MDGRRFDTWAKVLAHTGGRRAAIGLLASGALGAAAGLLGGYGVAARKPKKCPGGKKRCGKLCIGNRLCCTDKDCPKCEKCTAKGKCEGSGKKPCGRFCIAKQLCCRDKDCPACWTCNRQGQCEESLAQPLCNVCQKTECVNRALTCVTRTPGFEKVCGTTCCVNGSPCHGTNQCCDNTCSGQPQCCS